MTDLTYSDDVPLTVFSSQVIQMLNPKPIHAGDPILLSNARDAVCVAELLKASRRRDEASVSQSMIDEAELRADAIKYAHVMARYKPQDDIQKTISAINDILTEINNRLDELDKRVVEMDARLQNVEANR